MIASQIGQTWLPRVPGTPSWSDGVGHSLLEAAGGAVPTVVEPVTAGRPQPAEWVVFGAEHCKARPCLLHSNGHSDGGRGVAPGLSSPKQDTHPALDSV